MLIHLSNIGFEVADDSVAIMLVHKEKLCKINLKDRIPTGLKSGTKPKKKIVAPRLQKKSTVVYALQKSRS